MKTAMQELAQIMGVYYTKTLMQPEDKTSFAIRAVLYEIMKKMDDELLEKEKEQLQKAFSDGQETPINHPTIPHYSRDEYFNDNYNN